MRLTKLLAPPLRKLENPSSLDLLTAHGFIHKSASGIYDLLPLGLRVQQRIEAVIRKHMKNANCVEMAMSALVDPALWRKSGRLSKETEENFLFGAKHMLAPTGEEQVTTLVGSTSYRQLPLNLFQITRKYRNELRPKSGLLRTREFVMKDAYTFDTSRDAALESYEQMRAAYDSIFKELELPVVSAAADSGDMGGNLSHEYHLLSPLGEDTVLVCPSCKSAKNAEIDSSLHNCECGSQFESHSGIEIAHTFYLGTRYTQPFGSQVTLPDGETKEMHMGCYGIGVSRLVGAVAETLRNSRGLHWPNSIAPARACVVSPDPDESAALAAELCKKGVDVVAEDRTSHIGHALRVAREVGWPIILILGKRYKAEGLIELETRFGSALATKEQLPWALEITDRTPT